MVKLNRHIVLGLLVAALALPAGTAAGSVSMVSASMGSVGQDAPDMSYARDIQLNWQGQRSNQLETLYAQYQPQYQLQRKISASLAKTTAMEHHLGAKFVNVQLVNQNTYRVRLQKNGRIIDVYVDAYTGAVKN